MIDISKVKIIKSDIKLQNKFYKLIKKINKISKKYPTYMGIDFEFNTKKIATMQILFEVHIEDKIIKKYYIIYPPNLNQKIIDYLKYDILANPNIIKILHGSESLDIPWLVNEFFEMELKPIIDFILSMVDTRYLCEYLNISKSQKNICRIYDLLLMHGIIDQQEKDKLDENEDKMGEIYKIFIDINKLTPELITYAIHDVEYLTDAFLNLKMQIIKNNPKDYYLLIDCMRYCFMERRNITNIGSDLVTINMMNNYFYYINKSNKKTEIILEKILEDLDISPNLDKSDYFYKVSLIKTYNIIIKDFLDSYDGIKYILSINYIKTNTLNLLRTILYTIIIIYYKVKASHTEVFEYDLDEKYQLIIKKLKNLDLNYLIDLCNKFYEFCEIKLKP